MLTESEKQEREEKKQKEKEEKQLEKERIDKEREEKKQKEKEEKEKERRRIEKEKELKRKKLEKEKDEKKLKEKEDNEKERQRIEKEREERKLKEKEEKKSEKEQAYKEREEKKRKEKEDKEKQQKLLEEEKRLQKIEVLKESIDVNGEIIAKSDLANEFGDITNSSIANYIVKIYNPFRYNGNSYYYKNGIYILDETGVGKSKVSQIIDEIIEQMYPFEKLENKRIRVISEIQTLIMARNRFESDPFDQYNDMICCNNGILKFDWEKESVTLLPHSAQYIFRIKFNFTYNPDVNTDDIVKWLKSLSTNIKTGEINQSTYNNLIECASTSIVMQLTQGTFKLSYLVIGFKNSGKTTYTEDFLKKRFFGNDACSSTSLKSLCDDRFGKDDIIGKACNICDDISDSLVNYASEWKKLTGGARVEVEQKFRSKVNVLFPMAIFNANDYPKLQNVKEDLAFWDRWKVIEFKNNFKQDLSYANDNLDKYISPFLLLVIKKVFNLIKTKSVVKDDELNQKLIENWKRDTDSFYSFIHSAITFDVNGYTRQKYLYDMYIEFCKEKDFKLIKRPIMFKEEVLKMVSPLNEKVLHEKSYIDYDYVNIYRGIRLVTDPEGNYVKDVEMKKSKKVVEEKEKLSEVKVNNQEKLLKI